MVLNWNGKNAVLAFSFAQLASVIAYTLSFYVYFWYYTKQNKKDFPFKSIWEFFPNFRGKVCIYNIFTKLMKLIKNVFRNGRSALIFLLLCYCGVF